MSFVQIWVHVVWGTKNREPVLSKSIHDQICKHIKENAMLKNIYIDSINGYHDHLHCLMQLNSELSMAKQIQLIKGESSFWINNTKVLKQKFHWANEYFAVSVSGDKLKTIRGYISNQQEHHKKITFQQEYESFLKHFDCVPG